MADQKNIVIPTKGDKLVKSFMNDKFKQSLVAALPKHITPDKMLRVVLTECRKNPKLLECTQASFLGAILQCSQLGLLPSSMLQHSHLIPFKNNKKGGQMECNLIVGYRGYLELARRSGEISSFVVQVVRKDEPFAFKRGIEKDEFEHTPLGEIGKELIAAYFIVRFKDKSAHFELMFKNEIDRIRARSKFPEGVWATDYEEMAKKTVIRRAAKYLPQCAELQIASRLDDEQDIGEQDFTPLIDFDTDNLPDNNDPKTNGTQKALEALKAEGINATCATDDVISITGDQKNV